MSDEMQTREAMLQGHLREIRTRDAAPEQAVERLSEIIDLPMADNAALGEVNSARVGDGENVENMVALHRKLLADVNDWHFNRGEFNHRAPMFEDPDGLFAALITSGNGLADMLERLAK